MRVPLAERAGLGAGGRIAMPLGRPLDQSLAKPPPTPNPSLSGRGAGDGNLSLAGRGAGEATPSSRALTRARGAVGVPFRLHGRDLDGMDCVGLAAWAWEASVPTGYALRASPYGRIARELAALGFVRGAGPGAVVLVAPGPGQLHLGISTGAGIIHADAAARRVVERPAPLPWPVLAQWIREE